MVDIPARGVKPPSLARFALVCPAVWAWFAARMGGRFAGLVRSVSRVSAINGRAPSVHGAGWWGCAMSYTRVRARASMPGASMCAHLIARACVMCSCQV